MEEKYIYRGPLYFPDGSIVPYLLTEPEAILFLRLEKDKNPSRTLKYYREKNQLKGTRIGNNFCYTQKELLEFIDRATEWTNRKAVPN
ncbi:MAG: hypothetical protein ACYS9V_13765 [Planctomycetota bacterium]|jgi:hypothetical protein